MSPFAFSNVAVGVSVVKTVRPATSAAAIPPWARVPSAFAYASNAAWGIAGGRVKRRRLIAEALRPAAESHRWRDLTRFDATVLDGLMRLDCPGPQEEAATIALLLRQALDRPGETAALVTPDRALARRVASELERHGSSEHVFY